jgi:hypothetical protein
MISDQQALSEKSAALALIESGASRSGTDLRELNVNGQPGFYSYRCLTRASIYETLPHCPLIKSAFISSPADIGMHKRGSL